MKIHVDNTVITPGARVLGDKDALFMLYILGTEKISSMSTLFEFFESDSQLIEKALDVLSVNEMIFVHYDTILVLSKGYKLLQILGCIDNAVEASQPIWVSHNKKPMEISIMRIEGEIVEQRSEQFCIDSTDDTCPAAA